MAREWIKYFDADTVAKLTHIGFDPAGLVEGPLVGDHRSPFHGFAIEFTGHRGYVPGDDIKHIDWKAYYKTGRYLIKQYEQETNFVAHLVVDISESMKFEYQHGRKIDYAAFVAVALSQVITHQADSVGAFLFDNELRAKVNASNREEVMAQISAAIGKAEIKSPTALGRVLSHLAEQIGRRRVIFVISDFFGDLEATLDGLKRLMDARHEIVLIQVLDPIELRFDLMGRVRLIELEGQDKMDVVGANIRDSYEELFGAFLAELKGRVQALGLDYIPCDMSRPFGLHLAEYLSARMLRKTR